MTRAAPSSSSASRVGVPEAPPHTSTASTASPRDLGWREGQPAAARGSPREADRLRSRAVGGRCAPRARQLHSAGAAPAAGGSASARPEAAAVRSPSASRRARPRGSTTHGSPAGARAGRRPPPPRAPRSAAAAPRGRGSAAVRAGRSSYAARTIGCTNGLAAGGVCRRLHRVAARGSSPARAAATSGAALAEQRHRPRHLPPRRGGARAPQQTVETTRGPGAHPPPPRRPAGAVEHLAQQLGDEERVARCRLVQAPQKASAAWASTASAPMATAVARAARGAAGRGRVGDEAARARPGACRR